MQEAMLRVKQFKDRLATQLRKLPPQAANIPLVIERAEGLYIRMLEEENARLSSVVKPARKRSAPSVTKDTP